MCAVLARLLPVVAVAGIAFAACQDTPTTTYFPITTCNSAFVEGIAGGGHAFSGGGRVSAGGGASKGGLGGGRAAGDFTGGAKVSASDEATAARAGKGITVDRNAKPPPPRAFTVGPRTSLTHCTQIWVPIHAATTTTKPRAKR